MVKAKGSRKRAFFVIASFAALRFTGGIHTLQPSRDAEVRIEVRM